jgi:parallel beta helix pectate lyase-like protein
MSDCHLGLNEIALDLQGGRSSLTDCRIWGNDNLLGPIQVSGTASLEMLDTAITSNNGSGIVASDHAQLSISGGYITHHDGDGILLTGATTLDMRGVLCAENDGFGVRALSAECPLEGDHQLEAFSGTITGENNIIPTHGDYMSNGLGSICSSEYYFLTDPTPTEITVAPGQSIQEAIGAVIEGGTIYLSPGIYEEAIVVSKNVDLVAASHASNGNLEMGKTVIKGKPWKGAIPFSSSIEIRSDKPIDVSIRGLIIRSSGGAMSIEGSSNVTLFDVGFEDNEIGLTVWDGGVARAESCRFSGNDMAITLAWGGTCTLQECVIENNSTSGYAVGVWCSRLEVLDSTISDNQGGGILVRGGSVTELHLVDNTIVRNSYGLRVNMTACELERSPAGSPDLAPMSDYGFPTISGWGNTIPEQEEEEGNTFGAFDVWAHRATIDDLSFLTEPKPEEE